MTAEVTPTIRRDVAAVILKRWAIDGPDNEVDDDALIDAIAQLVADSNEQAVEDAIANGAYCIDCGKDLSDWRDHGSECIYRDRDTEEPG